MAPPFPLEDDLADEFAPLDESDQHEDDDTDQQEIDLP